jgi:hypothetical protein
MLIIMYVNFYMYHLCIGEIFVFSHLIKICVNIKKMHSTLFQTNLNFIQYNYFLAKVSVFLPYTIFSKIHALN